MQDPLQTMHQGISGSEWMRGPEEALQPQASGVSSFFYNRLSGLLLFRVCVVIYKETMQTRRAQSAASEAAVISVCVANQCRHTHSVGNECAHTLTHTTWRRSVKWFPQQVIMLSHWAGKRGNKASVNRVFVLTTPGHLLSSLRSAQRRRGAESHACGRTRAGQIKTG